jgi:tRNA 2-selenouridine synthase SelU
MDHNNNHDKDSTGVSVYKRDKQINEIQKKIEENRKNMFEKRLALKKYAKTHDSNHHIKEIVKKYDEYYDEYKTNVKLQVRALEEIIKHLNYVLEEQNLNQDLDLDSDDLVSRNKSQLKKDKTMILKEIDNLRKSL